MISSNLALFELALLDRGLVNKTQLAHIKHSVDYASKGFFESLLNLKTILAIDLYQTAAEIWSVPFIEIQSNELQQSDHLGIPDKVLAGLDAITLMNKQNDHFVALGSPEKLNQINQLSFFANTNFETVLADIHQIRKAQNQSKHKKNNPQNSTIDNNYLSAHLTKASALNASDIHIEMFNGYCRLRIRVDGILHPLGSITADQGRKLISQIKLLGAMDIAQSRLPQDGRFSYQLTNNAISLRVNSIPTINGEKLVLRLLEQHGKRFKLDQIGLFSDQYQSVREILKKPNGLILVAGPTGSGKTVTLYALLELLNTGKENISTIEDPVEIHEDGINQISINRKAGLDFSQALRALLRQDPDILMIGEIRDAETAEIAVKAAQTGHLVMATVHSRTANDATSRLLQLGAKKHALNEALRLVIAQRLPRKLCYLCRKKSKPPASLQQLMKSSRLSVPENIYNSTGCSSCLQGYSGRTGMFELLNHNENPSLNSLGNHSFDDDSSMSANLESVGLKRVALGDTSYEELIRVL